MAGVSPPLRRAAAIALLLARVGYGGALVAVPGRVAGRWLGPAARRGPSQVPLRALGAREVVIHAGALSSALAGRPLRGWMAASIAGDLTDVIATIIARRDLPPGAAGATVAVGGGSALLSGALAALSES